LPNPHAVEPYVARLHQPAEKQANIRKIRWPRSSRRLRLDAAHASWAHVLKRADAGSGNTDVSFPW